METIIEILIDNSNSMGNAKGLLKNYKKHLLADGSTRMELAKRILIDDIIPSIDYASKISVSLFHSLEPQGEPIKVIQQFIHEGKNDEQLRSAIKNISIPYETGGTPITGALLNCIKRLENYPDVDRKIILITDGEETGKSNYREAASNALKIAGIRCNIFIVGIALKPLAREKAELLAKETNGKYFNLQISTDESLTIKNELAKLKNDLIVDTVNKISKESREPKLKITEADEKITALERTVSQNSYLLKLISKQISGIHSEILKKEDENNFENEEVIVRENSVLNEEVRKASETYLYEQLRSTFGSRLHWLNKNGESGESYDFAVFDINGDDIDYYIECKGTIGKEKVFLMTKIEWSLFLRNHRKYQLYLITNALNDPLLIKIDNLMNWILLEKVVPYSIRNQNQKAERIIFSILE